MSKKAIAYVCDIPIISADEQRDNIIQHAKDNDIEIVA